MSDLREQGFRFVLRGESGLWVHPAEMKPGDVDCTDMTDEEFEAAVRAAIGRRLRPLFADNGDQ